MACAWALSTKEIEEKRRAALADFKAKLWKK
jgi:hypothetical protein